MLKGRSNLSSIDGLNLEHNDPMKYKLWQVEFEKHDIDCTLN